MKLKLRLKLSYLVLTLAVGLNAEPPAKSDQEKPVAAPPAKENIWIASKQNPKLKVDLLLPSRNRQPSLVAIVGEHIIFSNALDSKNQEVCLGQNINAVSLTDGSEFEVANVPCVTRLEPAQSETGASLLIYSRDLQTKKSQILKVEKIEANTKPVDFLPELMSAKNSSLHSARLAYFIDLSRSKKLLSLKRDASQTGFPFLSDDRMHLLTRISNGSTTGYFYDSYLVPNLTPKNPLPSVLSVTQLDERNPTDFTISKTGLAYVLLDGNDRKLGRIVWFEANFLEKVVSGFVGGSQQLSSNDWETLPKENLSFRKPRFIEPIANGFVAVETSNEFTWDYRFVFYYSHDQNAANRLTFLNTNTQNITGLKWYKQGLLVASDNGSIAWYGNENPFSNDKFKASSLEAEKETTPLIKDPPP